MGFCVEARYKHQGREKKKREREERSEGGRDETTGRGKPVILVKILPVPGMTQSHLNRKEREAS